MVRAGFRKRKRAKTLVYWRGNLKCKFCKTLSISTLKNGLLFRKQKYMEISEPEKAPPPEAVIKAVNFFMDSNSSYQGY